MMASFKRRRQKNSDCGGIKERRRPSTLLISVITILQLLASPPSVSTFAFGPQIPQRIQRTRTFASRSRVLHTYDRDNACQNYTSDTKKSKHNRKMAHKELFQAYHVYKKTQSTIEQLGLSHATLEQQAAHLDKTPSLVEKILVDGNNARQTLLLDNIPLVHSTVYKLTKARRLSKSLVNLSNEDLVQEGTIGLLRAIDKFDPSLGHAFSTYAVYWIRASVNRCIQSREEMIRVPEYLDRAISLINSVLDDEAVSQLMGDPTEDLMLKRVMKRTGLTESVIKEALKVKRRRMLQSLNTNGGYTMLEDYMMSGSYSKDAQIQQQQLVSDSQDIMRKGQLEYVKDVLGEYLSMREIEAISWRYGLLQYEEHTDVEREHPQEEEVPKATPNGARDYEAEAEEALFGPGTIFSPQMQATRTKVQTKLSLKINSSTPKAKITLSNGGRWGEAMSFKEVGEQMRVSAEYGRRLCSSALKKLQAAAEEGRLDPAMLF